MSAATATILVCEDDGVHSSLIEASLEPSGARCYAIRDGRHFQGALESVRPDAVILDVRLPGRSGISLLRDLRRHPTFGQVPVIVLTGAVRAQDREDALDAGADVFLTKPFSPRELAACLQRLLGARPAA